MRIITTSWDDGDIKDLRLAELLLKYNLPATFYIPQKNEERKVLPDFEIIALSKQFEIGGHTLNHVRIDSNDKSFIEKEVQGCFDWLKNLLGNNPTSFCFPMGKYNPIAVAAVFKSQFKVARTTELLSTKSLNIKNLMPTTVQLYEHSAFTYVKHLTVRKRWLDLIKWLQLNSITNLLKLSEAYLKTIIKKEGCFHLWGHSWEIDKYNLWNKLEQIFNLIANLPEFRYIQNGQILNIVD